MLDGWAVCLFRAASLLVCYATVRDAVFVLPLYPWNARLWLKPGALGAAGAPRGGGSDCAELLALLSPKPARGSLAVSCGPSWV